MNTFILQVQFALTGCLLVSSCYRFVASSSQSIELCYICKHSDTISSAGARMGGRGGFKCIISLWPITDKTHFILFIGSNFVFIPQFQLAWGAIVVIFEMKTRKF